MLKKPQTALDQYKNKRGGTIDQELTWAGRLWYFKHWRGIRLTALTAILAVAYVVLQPEPVETVNLTYDIDLTDADRGTLTITMIAEGNLPDYLDLEFPAGIFGDTGNGVQPHDPSGRALGADGEMGAPLAVEETDFGWRLATQQVSRAGFIYRIDLDRVPGSEEDIRRHISTPVAGGIRAAGFEIFLEPRGMEVRDITVSMHNPTGMPVLVPWPALVKGKDLIAERRRQLATNSGEASLGLGQGFKPGVGLEPATRKNNPMDTAASVPSNLLYHPRNMADLNNSLIICGNIRSLKSQARDTVIQYATDQTWLFADEAALELIRRIARTEMGFFGNSPTDQITVLLSANEVTSDDGFDVYGVHTGSSVLVMLDPETTWGMLEEQAASVIAHEMFHSWLGEAIPQSDPQMLWFTEGATTWYASRMLVSAGIWPPEHARGLLGARLERDYANNSLLGKMSVAAAAAEVMADAEQVRFGYAGGVNACIALDEMLARATGTVRPMDEIMRKLYEDRARGGLTREMLLETILEVTGVDCGVWLDTHVYGKTALPPSDQLI
ncbi:MAG: M1 family aminopeptidase [Candidatus Krumholzibacteria bacterium]|nr:M1 family aminopeptidase [Candidatus Krumholzibacteria bacterium]